MYITSMSFLVLLCLEAFFRIAQMQLRLMFFFLNVLQAQNYWWDCYVFPIYNPGQDILNKIEKSSKTGQDKKSLISTFACFLTAIDNV